MTVQDARQRAAIAQLGQCAAITGGLAVVLGALAIVFESVGQAGGATAWLVLAGSIAMLLVAAICAFVALIAVRRGPEPLHAVRRCRRQLRLLAVGAGALIAVLLVVGLLVWRPPGTATFAIVLACLAAAQAPLALSLLSR